MTRNELIEATSERSNIDKNTVKKVFDGLKDTIFEQLLQGNEVQLHGIGTFKVHRSEERNGRNPATGKPIVIAAKNRAKFYSSKSLDDSLNV